MLAVATKAVRSRFPLQFCLVLWATQHCKEQLRNRHFGQTYRQGASLHSWHRCCCCCCCCCELVVVVVMVDVAIMLLFYRCCISMAYHIHAEKSKGKRHNDEVPCLYKLLYVDRNLIAWLVSELSFLSRVSRSTASEPTITQKHFQHFCLPSAPHFFLVAVLRTVSKGVSSSLQYISSTPWRKVSPKKRIPLFHFRKK